MIVVMLFAKVSNKWRPLGEISIIQVPRIGEIIVKTIEGKLTYLKIIELLYNGDSPSNEATVIDIYAIEVQGVIANLYAS